jgi:hypothetical protein
MYGLLGSMGMFLYGLVPVMIDRLLLGGATAIVMSAGTGLISSFYSVSISKLTPKRVLLSELMLKKL